MWVLWTHGCPMTDLMIYAPDLALAYIAYIVATVSPGPANLAVIATSMSAGRRAGFALAAGVVMGSLTWGVLAALGLSAFLLSYGWLVSVMRIVGGVYLLWLAYKSFRSAFRRQQPEALEIALGRSVKQYFVRGLAIHLTNPKAIFAWLAIIAIGVSPGAPASLSFLIIAGCWFMGSLFYGGCAMVFSTRRMVRLYGALRQWIEGTAAVVFTLAGLKLLTSRVQ